MCTIPWCLVSGFLRVIFWLYFPVDPEPCFCSLSLLSVPVCHLGRRLVGAPEPISKASAAPVRCQSVLRGLGLCRLQTDTSLPCSCSASGFSSPLGFPALFVCLFAVLLNLCLLTCARRSSSSCVFGSGLWLSNPSQMWFHNMASSFLSRLEAKDQRGFLAGEA